VHVTFRNFVWILQLHIWGRAWTSWHAIWIFIQDLATKVNLPIKIMRLFILFDKSGAHFFINIIRVHNTTSWALLYIFWLNHVKRTTVYVRLWNILDFLFLRASWRIWNIHVFWFHYFHGFFLIKIYRARAIKLTQGAHVIRDLSLQDAIIALLSFPGDCFQHHICWTHSYFLAFSWWW